MRYRFFDSYRGFALILMAIYHFCFDLNQFGVLQENMNHNRFWLSFRAVIMSSFLGVVGVSFYLSHPSYEKAGFRSRLIKILVCALAISATSYFLNPRTWIYFGVLHLIFVASLLSPLLVRRSRFAPLFGGVLIVTPLIYRSHFFNKPFLVLSGLSPIKPNTEDFSPILPWMGVVLLGISLGSWVAEVRPKWAQREIPFLSKLGEHSLAFYMTHQLVLYPLAWLVSKLR